MELWNIWIALVNELSQAFTRKKTFFWFITILIGFTIKFDALGVTSIARGVGLLPCYYTCMLNFFHSSGVDLKVLRGLWVQLIFNRFNEIIIVNGRCLVVGDGIKIGKEGKKMPAVKWLHQESESNSKAEYIMGHSIQAIAILVKGMSTVFAVPLTAEIHEGIRLTYRDSRTLLDKMFELLIGAELPQAFYYIADKYYSSGKLMKKLFAENIHIITMMKKNAVAYYPTEPTNKKNKIGRPKKYGKKVKLFDLFKGDLDFISAPMPGDNKLTIQYCAIQLFWKPAGQLVNFIFVVHPTRGNAIVMSSDLTLSALDAIFCYSVRFKIEVAFKQAIHQVGSFMYRFWLKKMAKRKRKSGNQELQFASKDFKEKVLKKINAYHIFIQLGFIAQGLIQYLSIHYTKDVWLSFGTWLRTIRKNILPSEKVVSFSMTRMYPEFLRDDTKESIFKEYLRNHTDIYQRQAFEEYERLAA